MIDANATYVRLLQLQNCFWGSPDIGHVCRGSDCCASAEAFREELFAILCDLDLLMSRDSDIPSLDDWGLGLQCASRIVFGIMCHRLLPQCLTTALPTWADMEVVAEEGEDEAATIMRMRLRKKAFRSRMILTDPARMMNLCLLAVLGAPVQQNMLRIDSLDETGDTILECIRHETSPFVACRKELRAIIRRGCSAGGELTPIIEHFLLDDDVDLTDMLETARIMAQEFSVQSFYKTLFLKAAPFTSFWLVHPKASEKDKYLALADLFSGKPCCRSRACTAKMFRRFRRPEHVQGNKLFVGRFASGCQAIETCEYVE